MKIYFASLALLMIGVAGDVSESAATEPIVTGHLLISSHYNFRGVPQNEKGVLQPEIDVEMPAWKGGALAVTVWGNIDLSDDTGSGFLPGGNGGGFSEIDFTLSYARLVGPATTIVGATSYNFPGGGPATTEVHLGLAARILGLSSHMTAYRDVGVVRGVYVNGGITRTDALGAGFSSEVSATLGLTDADHARGYYGIRDTGLADMVVGASLIWTRWSGATVGVQLRHSRLLDGEKRDALRGSGFAVESSWAGLSLARRF